MKREETKNICHKIPSPFLLAGRTLFRKAKDGEQAVRANGDWVREMEYAGSLGALGQVFCGMGNVVGPEKDPRNSDGGEGPSHLEEFARGR